MISLIMFLSCKTNKKDKTKDYKYNTVKIKAEQGKNPKTKDLVNDIKYIPLEKNEKSIFGTINKLIYKNERFFILDLQAEHHLYVFNDKGRFINKIGEIGKGPGEYIRLQDFDISNNGLIYLYNRQFKKFHVYNSNGKFLFEKKMPFRARGFNLLGNNGFIFQLLKDNGYKKTKNRKIIVTDSNLVVKNMWFQYPPNFKDNRGRAGIFKECSQGILNNYPGSNDVYLFNSSGKLQKNYHFDFGKYSMPIEYKNDAFLKHEQNNKPSYKYLTRTPICINNKLMGNLASTFSKFKHFFMYNNKNEKYYEKELNINTISHKNINIPLASIGDSIVISYMNSTIYNYDKNKDELPNRIKKHLNNDGVVLLLYYLN
jgi:hypothetical protein